MAQSIEAIRQALGISPAVPDSDIKALMGTASGRKEIAKVEGQTKRQAESQAESKLHPDGMPNIPGLGGVENWLQENIYSPIGQAVTHPVQAMTAGFSGQEGHSAAPAEPKSKARKAKSAALPTPEQATTSPFTEIAQQLAEEYLGQVQQLQSLTSGAQTPGLESEAQGAAQSDLKGLTSGLPASVQNAMEGFVGAQPAVPLSGQVAGAQQKLGNAQSAGALGMAGAIGAMGPAEAETLGAAPYSTLLNELISESAYRASSPSYGPSALGLNTANTPAWLQTVLHNIGLPLTPPNSTSALSTPGLTTPGKAAPGGKSGTVPGSSGTTGGP